MSDILDKDKDVDKTEKVEKVEQQQEKTYTQKELEDILKQKETDFTVKEELLKSQLADTTNKLVETNSKVDKISEDFKALLTEREQEKIANMDEQKREKYLRDKAKAEKTQAEIEKEEALSRKDKEATEKLEKATQLIVNSTRKDLAVEMDLPKHLHKYVGGTDEETIKASINQLKEDYGITEEVIKTKVKEKVGEKFKNGGVAFEEGDIGKAKLDLKDFQKMTTMEKAHMMVNNRPLFDEYRALQKQYVGNLD